MKAKFFEKLQSSQKPYVIAELGSNHNGDMDLARELIVQAKSAGADCVKFQSWSKESIFSKVKYEDNCFVNDDYRGRTDYTMEEIVQKFAISEVDLATMIDFANELEMDCTSTPFSPSEAEFLVGHDVPFFKIASMDLNNYPFLEYVAGLKKPIVLSTGLSELFEIDRAIKTIEQTGNREIAILHCVATYPVDPSNVNLNNIETFSRLYPYPVGYSDHSLGSTIALAAVAKGAKIIEKHFTLDKEMFGWDHKISADYEEMREITLGAEIVARALGSPEIKAPESALAKAEFRRSVVAGRRLQSGERVELADIDLKRPGTGIPPADIKFVIGRSMKKDVEADAILQWSDFE
jgi:sialic acid synthase SpsE